MKNEKKQQIMEILHDVYRGKMTERTINSFADEVCHVLFAPQGAISDIMMVIWQYEDDADLNIRYDSYIFRMLLNLLENGETTARRLYDSFMYELDEWETFEKLFEDNSEYISEEELAKAKAKALQVFDSQFLELYGITE